MRKGVRVGEERECVRGEAQVSRLAGRRPSLGGEFKVVSSLVS